MMLGVGCVCLHKIVCPLSSTGSFSSALSLGREFFFLKISSLANSWPTGVLVSLDVGRCTAAGPLRG